jgi:hypothetical protein
MLRILCGNCSETGVSGNKNSIDLTGYYKIYLSKKAYRIVCRIIKDEIEIIEIGV